MISNSTSIPHYTPEEKARIDRDFNNTKLPKTSLNIPMPGTKEFAEWKANNADTFNGKPINNDNNSESFGNKLYKKVLGLFGIKVSNHLPEKPDYPPMPPVKPLKDENNQN